MSILDYKPNLPNIPAKTMGGEVCWNDLDNKGGYRLQQHKAFLNCRILDSNNVRVAWGDEGQMRAEFRIRTGGTSAQKAIRGDVIGVHRLAKIGIYDHYGIYENDDRIYEYNRNKDKSVSVHITSLKEFVGKSDGYFVLVLPEKIGIPTVSPLVLQKEAIKRQGIMYAIPPIRLVSAGVMAVQIIKSIIEAKIYHLYDADETIQRAKDRMGEKHYNILFNNCEHYALWCKTGVHKSKQVDAVLKYIGGQIKCKYKE